jgi:hypothetical protein
MNLLTDNTFQFPEPGSSIDEQNLEPGMVRTQKDLINSLRHDLPFLPIEDFADFNRVFKIAANSGDIWQLPPSARLVRISNDAVLQSGRLLCEIGRLPKPAASFFGQVNNSAVNPYNQDIMSNGFILPAQTNIILAIGIKQLGFWVDGANAINISVSVWY